MSFERPNKPETYLQIGMTVRIPESRIEQIPDYPEQTADGWTITDIHFGFQNEPLVLVEKPSMSKNIPVADMERENPKS